MPFGGIRRLSGIKIRRNFMSGSESRFATMSEICHGDWIAKYGPTRFLAVDGGKTFAHSPSLIFFCCTMGERPEPDGLDILKMAPSILVTQKLLASLGDPEFDPIMQGSTRVVCVQLRVFE